MNKFIKLKFILLLILIAGFIRCAPERVTTPRFDKESTGYWNDLANYIAGMPMSTSNRFYNLGETSYYKRYQLSIDKSWENIEKNYRSKIKELTKEILPPKSYSNTGFYPLSGADFLNLYHFSPKSPRYIMVGLETPGFVNDPLSYNPLDLREAYLLLNISINQMATQNYFASIMMEAKFKNKYFPGVAPVLMIFLKRLGFEIDYLESIRINSNGDIEELKTSSDVGQNTITGIRFVFHAPGEMYRELIFLKMYIHENTLNPALPEGKFFARQNRFNLVMKSSIYLMHLEKFRPFVNSLLSKTDMVAEDDSGIPIRYFNPNEWDVQVFGKYIRRISIRYIPREAKMIRSPGNSLYSEMEKFTQTDLKSIFENSAKPLNFKYGYGGAMRGVGTSNLIVVRRKYLLK